MSADISSLSLEEKERLYSMCWRKLVFATEREARRKALHQRPRQRWYQCPNCAGWHLTKRRGK